MLSKIKNLKGGTGFVGGLVVAVILVPALAGAAVAGTIIQGGTAAGQASVGKAHQLLTNEADQKSYVLITGGPDCASGGFYTIPAGKALVITGADFYLSSGAVGVMETVITVGAKATPCSKIVAAGLAEGPSDASQNQVFQPGIAVPAGDAVGAVETNNDSLVSIYGYLVPSAAVGPLATPHISPGWSARRSLTLAP